MDGWMDKWMDEWMDGGMDKQTAGWTGGSRRERQHASHGADLNEFRVHALHHLLWVVLPHAALLGVQLQALVPLLHLLHCHPVHLLR